MSAYIADSATVYPRIIEERSDDGSITVKITRKMFLVLHKASATLSRVRVDTLTKGVIRHEVINGSTLDEDLYIDAAREAALIVHRIGDGVELTGMISDKIRIHPVPESSRTLLQLAGAHQLETIHKTKVTDSASNRINNISPDVLVESRAPRYQDNSIVYPEVFVAVNIKLESLMMPRVQLRLAGFTRGEAMDRSLRRVTYYHVDADLTLKQFHLQASMSQFGNPDIFLLLTGHDLIGPVNGRYDPTLSGFSPVGGMCNSGQNALISEDVFLSFSGLDVTAHEFGHMLGAPHDVYPAAQDLIRQSLSYKSQSCLALTFVHDYLTQLPGVYPGHEFNGDFFCKAMHRHTPNIYFPRQLPNILQQCRVTCNERQGSNGAYKYYTHHALEGTPCHSQFPNAICRRGQCVQR
ncbi:hypothetical protein MTO96_006290 [Rhipicephalus appendiculatus]